MPWSTSNRHWAFHRSVRGSSLFPAVTSFRSRLTRRTSVLESTFWWTSLPVVKLRLQFRFPETVFTDHIVGEGHQHRLKTFGPSPREIQNGPLEDALGTHSTLEVRT